MSEMLQKVAIAIKRPMQCSTEDALYVARRVLEAMREPTLDMERAASQVDRMGEGGGYERGHFSDEWSAAIDAALASTSPPGK